MLGVYIGVFWPAESIPGVYFTLEWLVFAIMGRNLFFWTRGGVKIPWFQSSKLCNFRCLSRGFLTGWIDSWCLFYSRVIGFRENGPKIFLGTTRMSKNSTFSQCPLYRTCPVHGTLGEDNIIFRSFLSYFTLFVLQNNTNIWSIKFNLIVPNPQSFRGAMISTVLWSVLRTISA